jgi:hypothetical protein
MIPGFQMPPGIPGERRHPVAQLDAVFLQPLRHLERAGADVAVVGGADRPLDRPADDFAVAVKQSGVIDDAMAQKRPVLHQPKHGIPPVILLFGPAPHAGQSLFFAMG